MTRPGGHLRVRGISGGLASRAISPSAAIGVDREPSPLPLRPGQCVIALCPADAVTGGPEALHQLIDALANFGVPAAIAYLAPELGRGFRTAVEPAETPAAYARYRVPLWRDPVPDDPDVVVVLPEVWSLAADEFQQARVGLWWLSVDNNLVSPFGRYFQRRRPTRPLVHLYQSAYARNYLQSHGIVGAALGDYLSDAHLAPPAAGDRQRRIAFNPKKGFATTMQIIQRSLECGVDADWVPIAGLDPAGVAALLGQCRVYIDFGPHPGMDRLPREAALAGCAIVTGRRGAAAYAEDIPIPAGFRIPDTDIDRAVATIAACLDDPALSELFEPYRTWIRGQRERFFEQVATVFGLDRAVGVRDRLEPVVRARTA